jgi:hypothetical protein
MNLFIETVTTQRCNENKFVISSSTLLFSVYVFIYAVCLTSIYNYQ